jgi:hypothetical protein
MCCCLQHAAALQDKLQWMRTQEVCYSSRCPPRIPRGLQDQLAAQQELHSNNQVRPWAPRRPAGPSMLNGS